MPIADKTLIEILDGLKSAVAANSRDIIAMEYILLALLKTVPKANQEQLLDLLQQLQPTDLPQSIKDGLEHAIALASSVIVSNDPADWSKTLNTQTVCKGNA